MVDELSALEEVREVGEEEEKEMSLLEHLEELRRRVIRIAITILAIMALSLTFGIRWIELGGTSLPILYPNIFNSVAAEVLNRMQKDLLPASVEIIQITPGQALLSLIYVALFIGILLGMPIIAHEVAAFVKPGLTRRERRMISRILLPAALLFSLGAAVAYTMVVKTALDFLYAYGGVIEARTFLTVVDFISFTLLIMVAMGATFQLPLAMWVLTDLGIVEPSFWRRNLSYAIVAMIILGAMITPDGSGVTMWFIAIPMMLLYVGTYWLIERRMGKRRGQPNHS